MEHIISFEWVAGVVLCILRLKEKNLDKKSSNFNKNKWGLSFFFFLIIKFLFYFMFCWERKTKGERFDLLGHEEFIFYVFFFLYFLI